MFWKIIFTLLVLGFLAFAGWYTYQNLPGEPQVFQVQNPAEENHAFYSSTPVFYDGMRFRENEISYYIENSCSANRIDTMKEAFSTLQTKANAIAFYPAVKSEAEILVGCSQDYLAQGENSFIAGEGGPVEIINTSRYYVITEGKIMLYRQSECEEPIVELHELLHVLGFDHSQDKNNIMYPTASCSQEISQNTIETINELYSQEALPDLYIFNISAVKKGRYLDFDIEVRNQGLKDSENASLSILSGEEKVEIFYLDAIEIGAGKKIWAKNIKLPSRDTEAIEIVIDRENAVREIHEDNNKAVLSV